MNSEDSPSENTTRSIPEDPVVEPQDYSPPPPEKILGEEHSLAKQEPEKKSTLGKVLPLAAAGAAALAAVGAVAYAKSRNGDSSSQEGDDPPPELPLDINKASAEELMYLPHIGPVFAKKIIDARPFKAVEDILEVQGIGEHYLEDIAPHLKV